MPCGAWAFRARGVTAFEHRNGLAQQRLVPLKSPRHGHPPLTLHVKLYSSAGGERREEAATEPAPSGAVKTEEADEESEYEEKERGLKPVLKAAPARADTSEIP